MIIIGVGAIYAYHTLGQYALAFRFTTLPSALLGLALGQVYLREAALRVNSPALALRAFYRMAAVFAAVSVVPMAVIGLWGQALFGLFFGPEWRLSGIYATAMMPLVWARFVASPMSSVFLIYGKQRILLLFQSILLVIVVVTMLVASRVWVVAADTLGRAISPCGWFLRRDPLCSIAHSHPFVRHQRSSGAGRSMTCAKLRPLACRASNDASQTPRLG